MVAIYLAMSGQLLLCSNDTPLRKHDHVVFSLDNGKELRYNDPRCFGLIEVISPKEVFEEALVQGGATINNFCGGHSGSSRMSLRAYGRKDEPCLRRVALSGGKFNAKSNFERFGRGQKDMVSNL